MVWRRILRLLECIEEGVRTGTVMLQVMTGVVMRTVMETKAQVYRGMVA
jgi:hypothetical protein